MAGSVEANAAQAVRGGGDDSRLPNSEAVLATDDPRAVNRARGIHFHSFERSQRVTGLCGHAPCELPNLKSRVSAPKSPTDV